MKVKTVSYRSPTAAQEFTDSFRQTGFAVVSDHPIQPQLIQESFREWERFFSSEEKHLHRYDPVKQSGYFPFRTENAKDYSKKDLKEFYHHYPWDQFPKQVSEFTPQLYRALLEMSRVLLAWVEQSTPAEVRAGFSMPLTQMIDESQEILLRAIHYPPLTGTEEEGAVRAAAHEDINLITLLPAATAAGLQVKDLNGVWHDVPCDPGTVVVNSGDMLKAASGDYYPSTTHRVMNPTGEASRLPRYSMPLFLHPRREVLLAPGLTAGGYLQQRLREIGLKA